MQPIQRVGLLSVPNASPPERERAKFSMDPAKIQLLATVPLSTHADVAQVIPGPFTNNHTQSSHASAPHKSKADHGTPGRSTKIDGLKPLTVSIFECCEIRSGTNAPWNTVEISWREDNQNNKSDQSITISLQTIGTGVEVCTGAMDCESYPALEYGTGAAVKIPEGKHYWTRLIQLKEGQTSAAPEHKTVWQYLGITQDGDDNGVLEVLVCGQLREHVPSKTFWTPYTCDASRQCNISSHPCCKVSACESMTGAL
jgi:hypothetical protein